MDNKNQVVLTCKKVDSFKGKLKNSVDKKNVRLTKKYVSQMQESLDTLMELLVAVEIGGVDLSEPWIVEAKRFEELGQASLSEAEEYVFEVEDSELDNANERIIEVRIQDLISSLNSFKDSLKTSASKIIQDVVEVKQSKAIHEIITQKRDQMSSFKSSKITICSEVSKDMFVSELCKN